VVVKGDAKPSTASGTRANISPVNLHRTKMRACCADQALASHSDDCKAPFSVRRSNDMCECGLP